jgi:hypothetical protein
MEVLKVATTAHMRAVFNSLNHCCHSQSSFPRHPINTKCSEKAVLALNINLHSQLNTGWHNHCGVFAHTWSVAVIGMERSLRLPEMTPALLV